MKTIINFLNISETDSDIVEKLVKAEASLKNVENVTLILFKELKESQKSLEMSERKAQQANLKFLSMQDELTAIQKRGGANQGNSDELEAVLKEKEMQLAMATSEITEKDNLLAEASGAVVNLKRDQLLIFNHSQKLSDQLKTYENAQKMTDNNFKMIIAAKDKEMQDAKFENHRLAEMIFRDEQIRAQQDA